VVFPGARTLFEQVVEDILLGAGAIEQQLSGDPMRPLWMWPVAASMLEGMAAAIRSGEITRDDA